MIVEVYQSTSLIPETVVEFVNSQVSDAFDLDNGKPFEVNAKKYFRRNNGKITPAVVNSADYISKKFQQGLVDRDWTIEKEISGQTIDGYIAQSFSNLETNSIDEGGFRNLVGQTDLNADSFLSDTQVAYNEFFKRKCFKWCFDFGNEFILFHTFSDAYRIGLEFETGNIASSFRAFAKLNVLYESGSIDVGVFVTSLDTKVSKGIWPSSNRNGSITELENRRFMEFIKFPSIIIGFAPDAWSEDAEFLGKDGFRYPIAGETKSVNEDGIAYLEHLDHGVFSLDDSGELDLSD